MPQEPLTSPETPNFTPKLYSLAALIAVIVIGGMWLIARLTSADLARDMQHWQEKLNLIAESRTAEVNNWVSGHFKGLRALANNPSLQLYVGELQAEGQSVKAPSNIEPAQKSYLRNVLVFTAEQLEFIAPDSSLVVNANVPARESRGGLAVVNNKGEIIVSTAMVPNVANFLLARIKDQPPGQESLLDIHKDSDGTPYIGFAVPIFPIQGEHDAASQIGKVVGIKVADQHLFNLLTHPGTTEQTLETLLVRPIGGNKLDYLSPLQDGTATLGRQIEFDPRKSAEAGLIQTIGNFLSDRTDYRNQPVLATSRDIAGTPWTLIVKIDRQEALEESAKQRTNMVVLLLLIIIILALIIAIVWWHAHSERAIIMSRHFRKLAAQSFASEQLLRLVADHQPEPTYIIDAHSHYHFANHRAALEAGMSVDFILGKTLSDVRGSGRAGYIQEHCEYALKHNRIVYDIATAQGDKGERVIRSAFVPLEHIPVASLPERTPGVLVVEQDISEVIRERERRLETQDQLIQTLIRLVDRRDPFAANHSLLVSQMANKIATDMELYTPIIETTRIAGCLMNIGKIVIPPELLTKTSGLTKEEKQTIQESMLAAADLIAVIHFDGPVSETLHQWQEHWDGTGPLGLRGEAILISARIIAVANAFIGMISPRSWRTAIPIESATKFLLDQSDTHFDRRVVIALVNYIENHNGRAWVEHILREQRGAS